MGVASPGLLMHFSSKRAFEQILHAQYGGGQAWTTLLANYPPFLLTIFSHPFRQPWPREQAPDSSLQLLQMIHATRVRVQVSTHVYACALALRHYNDA